MQLYLPPSIRCPIIHGTPKEAYLFECSRDKSVLQLVIHTNRTAVGWKIDHLQTPGHLLKRHMAETEVMRQYL